ncbi:MAG: Slp family lipoprotein [Nitrospira defluvii]|nr:Slp family lipoprotein [Nitrospira defluvii]
MNVPWAIILVAAAVTACTGATVIPPNLEERVDRNLSFDQLKAAPASYQGRLVVFGGSVLSARRLKDATRIEVLQLPLDSSLAPVGRPTDSHGRFLVFHKEFLDPAALPPGTRVTVVGEVVGAVTLALDEIDYVYPSLDSQAVTVWPPRLPTYWFRPYPYFGAYWGPFWGPYWAPYWVP